MITVKLLGPVELVLDRDPVLIPGAGERALLSLLALDVGRLVSADRLIDALWGEDLPANPTNALQTRVSKLRKLVGDAVQTRPGGYVLDAGRAAVDVAHFRTLVAERRFAEALAVWRGPAFEEFAGRHWADAASFGLDAERLRALEGRIDADLASGRHAELVGELEVLVREHPSRERFRAQLVTALYRTGRQVDALETIRHATTYLADELGLDPGTELVELEAAILRHDPRLDGAPPAAVAAEAGPELPVPLTALVGRDRERERCRGLLRRHRLVTLTGPGGAGKTALATEVARRIAGEFPDGAWFVRLADTGDASRVAQAVVDAVGIAAPDARAPRDLLTGYLARRRALLVLDNCEHLADAVAGLAGHLLRAGADLRILATSRGALGIVGEVQVPLPPLTVDPAVELFAERAVAVSPGFTLDDRTRPVVADVCERLDGMPLAIELAAARTRSLAVDTIAARLDDRFRLLSAGPRTAEARHRTLEATVAWSHDLLDADERTLFRRLAIFVGGWALEDAEAVCAGDGLAADDVLDTLDRLVDRSLVVADMGRFRLLETMRAYAMERLEAAGERDQLATRHAAHFGRLAEGAGRGLRGPEQTRWLATLRVNDGNLHAALDEVRAAGDVDRLLRLTAGLAWFWYVGRHGDGRRVVNAALAAAPDASPGARALALQALSIVERPGGCIVHPSDRADAPARLSIPLFLAAGDRHGALLSEVLSAVRAVAGVDVAPTLERLATQAAELTEIGDRWSAALADFVAMEIHLQQGEIDAALALADRARAGFTAIGDAWGTSALDAHLGQGLRLAGQIDEAVAVLERGLAHARAAGMTNTVAGISLDLASAALDRGDVALVDEALSRARAVAGDLGNTMFVALAELGSASAALLRGEVAAAFERAAGATDRLREENVSGGMAMGLTLMASCEARLGHLPVAEDHAREALDVASSVRNPGLRARALEALAVVAAEREDGRTAARLLGAAAALRRARQRPANVMEALDVAHATERARAQLGSEAFAAAAAAADPDEVYATS